MRQTPTQEAAAPDVAAPISSRALTDRSRQWFANLLSFVAVAISALALLVTYQGLRVASDAQTLALDQASKNDAILQAMAVTGTGEGRCGGSAPNANLIVRNEGRLPSSVRTVRLYPSSFGALKDFEDALFQPVDVEIPPQQEANVPFVMPCPATFEGAFITVPYEFRDPTRERALPPYLSNYNEPGTVSVRTFNVQVVASAENGQEIQIMAELLFISKAE